MEELKQKIFKNIEKYKLLWSEFQSNTFLLKNIDKQLILKLWKLSRIC